MTASSEDPGIIYEELGGHFSEFSDEFESLFGQRLQINAAQLGNVAQSYVFDLGRYVKFHELEIPDRARRGAYVCKWLMKLRPIYFDATITHLPEEIASMLLLANELFAMYVTSAITRVDLEKSLSERMGNILLYSLRYRSSSEDSFILFLAQLCLLK